MTIGNSVTSIGEFAFNYCGGLTSVTIGNSVTSIGEFAFNYCFRLTKAEFASIESLCKINFVPYNSNPLSYARHLYINGQEVKDLVIPESVTNIGDYTFSGCSWLTSVTIPESVTSIGSGAFSGCSGLTSLTIPESVTSIGSGAFSGCSGLTSLTIPESMTSIGNEAFYNCSELASVTINSNEIVSEGSISVRIHYFFGEEVKEYIIGNHVESIGEMVFSHCSGLTSVTIPNSVTSIGSGAFYNCSRLTSVTIPNSVTSIGRQAFYGCSGLTSVTIGNSVTSIGSGTFGCRNLSSITVHRTEPEKYHADYSIFYYIGLEDGEIHKIDFNQAVLYVPKGCAEAYAQCYPWSLFQNIVEFSEALPGDVNSDDEVNGADIVAVINYVLNDNVADGDINNDGEVNGADVVAVINYVLEYADQTAEPQASTAQRVQAKTADTHDWLSACADDSGIVIGLTNQTDFTAFQFMLQLPDGCELDEIVADAARLSSHVLLFRRMADGRYFVLGYDMNNGLIDGQDGTLLNLRLTGNTSGGAAVTEVRFFTPEAQTRHLAGVQTDLATGLASPEGTAATTAGNIYDVQGRLVMTAGQYSRQKSALPAGIYVRNGQKFMAK